MSILTYSSATCFHACRPRYYWQYDQCLRRKREEESEPLVIGSATHVGMKTYAETGDVDQACQAVRQWEESRSTLGSDLVRRRQQACKACACVRVAAEEWPIVLIAPEKRFDAPIRNPATGRTSRNFRFAGRMDGRQDNRVIDWKTTDDPARFIKLVALSCQMECYALADDLAIQGIEYRLIRTPRIKLKLAGVRRKEDQTRQDYENECVAWIKSQENGVMTYPQYITPQRLDVARHWLWHTAKAIAECRRTSRWFFNRGACYDWNRECTYMPLCQQIAFGGNPESLIEIDYEQCDPHPELQESESAPENPDAKGDAASGNKRSYYWRYSCPQSDTKRLG